MIRMILVIAALTGLAGCAAAPGGGTDAFVGGPQQSVVARGSYTHSGPPALTLITVRNNRTGFGAHTALLINAGERVIFDPAGSFHHEEIERRGDVLIGIDPAFWQGFKSMHARATHHVVTQRIEVSPAVAARALELAYARGEVAAAHCAHSTGNILRQLPGFSGIDVGYYPNDLAEQFERITGAPQVPFYENFTPQGAVAS
ncbi:hypothetical protein [Pseudooceanicola aestuarii]|uniref:hypothetical protein n=1 Tax=Pseudooceanicola aestuarii TaxID=2697319 RepID=UPI0013D41057|nr:hypothetical protein [Pseudooceanicola aestuarii]